MKLTGINALTGRATTLTIQDGRIQEGTPASSSPSHPWISPGFLDAQVNGLNGHDYSGPNLSDESIRTIVDALARSGTTRHVATIITSPRDRILRNLGLLAEAIKRDPDIAAAIPALHVEGPFIAPEDGPRGAHDLEWVRNPDGRELRDWCDAADGHLRLITLAPERPGAVEVIEQAVERGITVAIGHTAADGPAIARAVRAGATLSTHLGNGSHPTLPRLRNYLWEQLGNDALRAGLIADGYHIPDSVIRVIARAKGLDHLMLVSDVARCAGLPVGIHRWGDVEVEVHEDGHLSLSGTSLLAGAGYLLDRCIAVFARATGLPLHEVVPLCTTNPARFLNLPEPSLEVGATADLVVFRWDGVASQIEIERVVKNGRELGR